MFMSFITHTQARLGHRPAAVTAPIPPRRCSVARAASASYYAIPQHMVSAVGWRLGTMTD
jgi:hypothetical protein